jgi:hypothetical protein
LIAHPLATEFANRTLCREANPPFEYQSGTLSLLRTLFNPLFLLMVHACFPARAGAASLRRRRERLRC